MKKQEDKMMKHFNEMIKKMRKNSVYELPDKPWKEDTIMKRMESAQEECYKTYSGEGKLSGGVYTEDVEYWNFIGDVMKINITSNPLHILEF